MGVIKTVLIVAFVIVCILAILLVLVQNDESNGMGSAFGGNSAAFGAHSGSVLKKTTGVLVFLFFVITFGLGLVNKASKKDDLSATAAAVQGEVKASASENGSWLENELSGSAAKVEEAPAEAAETSGAAE